MDFLIGAEFLEKGLRVVVRRNKNFINTSKYIYRRKSQV